MIETSTLRDLIAKNIGTTASRNRMAVKMTPSLRKFRDYTAVGRKAFLVEDLEDGAEAIYDKDPEITAYVVAEEGDNVLSVARSRRVHFPTFEIASNPQNHVSQIKQRRYDQVKRSIELGVSAVKEKEDIRVFAVINSLATDPNNPHTDIAIAAPLTADIIADAFAQIEEHGLRVARIFMNGRDYADLRKFDRDVIDPETQQALFRTGYVGKVYGAQVIRTRVIQPGTVYICGEREYYGRFPVRTELTVITADVPQERIVGFSIFQEQGVGAYNPLASQRLLIARS